MGIDIIFYRFKDLQAGIKEEILKTVELKKELAKLSYFSAEEKKALGIKEVE